MMTRHPAAEQEDVAKLLKVLCSITCCLVLCELDMAGLVEGSYTTAGPMASMGRWGGMEVL